MEEEFDFNARENSHNRGEVGVIDSDKRGSSESSHQSIKDGDQVKYKDHKMMCSFYSIP